MFSWLRKKESIKNIREWDYGDIPHIMRLMSQNPRPDWNYEYDAFREWMRDDRHYGLVIEEDNAIRGCIMAFAEKNNRAYIHLFQIDKDYRRQGYGMRLMHRLFSKALEEWNKSLCFDVSDKDKDMHLFLASKKIGFVVTEMHEFYEEYGEPAATFYTFEYPPPWGFKRGTIRIKKDGKGIIKSFP